MTDTIKLMQLPDAGVLATAGRQDRYFIIGVDGSTRWVSVAKAVALYRLHGADPEKLLWKKTKRKRPSNHQAKSSDSSEWRQELARKLGMAPDDR